MRYYNKITYRLNNQLLQDIMYSAR